MRCPEADAVPNSPFDPFDAMRMVSLVAMVLLIAPRVLPPLRPYARPLGLALVVIYGVAMFGFFAWAYLL
jgi:hypothetical protein